MDAARCAKRMGADEVYIVYRRSEKELPARLEEIHHAKEEGVVFKFLTAPLEVLSDENFNVTGLKCQQMELGEAESVVGVYIGLALGMAKSQVRRVRRWL